MSYHNKVCQTCFMLGDIGQLGRMSAVELFFRAWPFSFTKVMESGGRNAPQN